MKLQTKKIIAREFLFLVSAICVGFISYFIIYSYNHFIQNKVDKLSQQIALNDKISSSLSKSLTTKFNQQLWFSNKYYKEYLKGNHKTAKYFDDYGIPIMGDNNNLRVFERLKNLSQNDSVIILGNEKNSFEEFGRYFNFINLKGFKIFIDENIITKDDINKEEKSEAVVNKTKSFQLERDILTSKIISYRKQSDLVFKICLYFLLAVFVFRYIFYGIRWSIQTLKQK